jgi:hypothetical protein
MHTPYPSVGCRKTPNLGVAHAQTPPPNSCPWGTGARSLGAVLASFEVPDPSEQSTIGWTQEDHVDLSRKAIKTSPEWNETEAIQREYEARLHRHYGRSAYWEDEGLRDERWYSTPPYEHPSA